MSDPLVPTAPELPTPLKAIRIELVTTAVNFLNDPQVKSAPLSKRLAFLEGKGLTQEEIDLAIIKSNNGSANNNNNTNIPQNQSQHTQTAQTQTHSGYKGLLLTTAIVLGTGSLLISNYQSIKSFAQKLMFGSSDETTAPSYDELKRIETEFKQSIQELRELMETKEKKLQETLEQISQK